MVGMLSRSKRHLNVERANEELASSRRGAVYRAIEQLVCNCHVHDTIEIWSETVSFKVLHATPPSDTYHRAAVHVASSLCLCLVQPETLRTYRDQVHIGMWMYSIGFFHVFRDSASDALRAELYSQCLVGTPLLTLPVSGTPPTRSASSSTSIERCTACRVKEGGEMSSYVTILIPRRTTTQDVLRYASCRGKLPMPQLIVSSRRFLLTGALLLHFTLAHGRCYVIRTTASSCA